MQAQNKYLCVMNIYSTRILLIPTDETIFGYIWYNYVIKVTSKN